MPTSTSDPLGSRQMDPKEFSTGNFCVGGSGGIRYVTPPMNERGGGGRTFPTKTPDATIQFQRFKKHDPKPAIQPPPEPFHSPSSFSTRDYSSIHSSTTSTPSKRPRSPSLSRPSSFTSLTGASASVFSHPPSVPFPSPKTFRKEDLPNSFPGPGRGKLPRADPSFSTSMSFREGRGSSGDLLSCSCSSPLIGGFPRIPSCGVGNPSLRLPPPLKHAITTHDDDEGEGRRGKGSDSQEEFPPRESIGEPVRAPSVPRQVSPDAEALRELDKENTRNMEKPPASSSSSGMVGGVPPLRARSIRFFEPIQGLSGRRVHPLEVSEVLGVLPGLGSGERGGGGGGGSPGRRLSTLRGDLIGEEKGRLSEVSAYEPAEGEPEIDEVRYLRDQEASESADADVIAWLERRNHQKFVVSRSQRAQDALRMGNSTTPSIATTDFNRVPNSISVVFQPPIPRYHPQLMDDGFAMIFSDGPARDASPPVRERSVAPAELREERQREAEKRLRKVL
ncbi:unnamed protein product [Phytomonas sp. EM1]|nr:unnamed protein product [Phytomonas sp. EM1]|eukprot:CCW63952.1 unnamed protein product [Phytomonas sp. isolate EM1]